MKSEIVIMNIFEHIKTECITFSVFNSLSTLFNVCLKLEI